MLTLLERSLSTHPGNLVWAIAEPAKLDLSADHEEDTNFVTSQLVRGFTVERGKGEAFF